MIEYFFILNFIISVGAAVGAILLLHKILETCSIQWISSYLYYIVLATVYGIFAILGTAFIESLLEILEINVDKRQTIVLVFPLLGIPVLLTAWYMLIKFVHEIYNNRPKQIFTFSYYGITILFFLVYGLIIKSLAEQGYYNLNNFIEYFKIIIVLLKIITLAYAFIPLLIQIKQIDKRFTPHVILLFSSLFVLLQLLNLVIFILMRDSQLMVFLFLFSYFTAEIVPVLYLYKYIEKSKPIFTDSYVVENSLQEFIDKYEITKRETEIIQQICMGKSNKEISDKLFISLQTVKDHVHNIFVKTGIKNRVQLSNMVKNSL